MINITETFGIFDGKHKYDIKVTKDNIVVLHFTSDKYIHQICTMFRLGYLSGKNNEQVIWDEFQKLEQ